MAFLRHILEFKAQDDRICGYCRNPVRKEDAACPNCNCDLSYFKYLDNAPDVNGLIDTGEVEDAPAPVIPRPQSDDEISQIDPRGYDDSSMSAVAPSRPTLAQSNAVRPEPYLNPDTMYAVPGSTTFIYTSDGKIYYGDDYDTQHWRLIGAHPELVDTRYRLTGYYRRTYRQRAAPAPSGSDSEGNFGEPREICMQHGDLAGRVGNDKNLASFWNTNVQSYDSLLVPCLNKLIQDGLLSGDGKVSTPIHDTVPIASIEGAQTKELSASDHEQMELYKQLHLMRGVEKHAAMKKLGVGGTKPHPVQTAMDKANLRMPGQKWWAMNSESFARRLNSVLENLF